MSTSKGSKNERASKDIKPTIAIQSDAALAATYNRMREFRGKVRFSRTLRVLKSDR
ncbi:MAG: hypothetical protein ABI824_16725 [Acidobacteriota bacterium]